jgi:hypothetical protein
LGFEIWDLGSEIPNELPGTEAFATFACDSTVRTTYWMAANEEGRPRNEAALAESAVYR